MLRTRIASEAGPTSSFRPPHRAAGWLAALLLVGAFASASCARSSLRIGGQAAGSGGGGGSGAEPPIDAGSGGSGGKDEPIEPLDCVLAEPRGPARPPALDRPDFDVHTTSLVVNDFGDGASSRAGRAVLQGVTSNMSAPASDGIEATLLDVDRLATDELVSVVLGPTLLAPETWTYAQMVPSHRTRSQVAVAYNGGPGWVRLRTLGIPTWAASPAVDVWLGGGTPLAMASGAGLGEMGIGHAGHGYGMVWNAEADMPAAAVLSEEGELMLGPHAILGVAPVPGASAPAMIWSGQAYLTATAVTQCAAPDPLCVGRGVVISRVRPASGDAWDDSGIDRVAALAMLPANARIGRASLASFEGRTAVAWPERTDSDDGPSTVRISQLAPDGQPLGPARLVATDARPTHSLRLAASALGLVLVWPEPGDAAAPDDALGRSRLMVHHFDFDLEPRGPVQVVPSTRFSSYGFPTAVALDHPRGVLLSWSSRSMTTSRNTVSLAWLDCVDR